MKGYKQAMKRHNAEGIRGKGRGQELLQGKCSNHFQAHLNPCARTAVLFHFCYHFFGDDLTITWDMKEEVAVYLGSIV